MTDDGVRVGALARHADVLATPDVRRVQPLVALALANVAHATIRNRGTTVGSIVHADAAAEMPVVLPLLGGSVDVEGPAGRRTIPADELFVGPLESSLRPRRDRRRRRSSRRWRRVPASPSRRSPGGTATTRWSAWPRCVDGESRRRAATCRSATCRPSST